MSEEGGAQLMQTGERELHLGLHPGHPYDPVPGDSLGVVIQQGGFPDARLTAYDQDGAAFGHHRAGQPVERVALTETAAQSQLSHHKHRPLRDFIQNRQKGTTRRLGSKFRQGRNRAPADP